MSFDIAPAHEAPQVDIALRCMHHTECGQRHTSYPNASGTQQIVFLEQVYVDKFLQ
jgi:hypothetical protein